MKHTLRTARCALAAILLFAAVFGAYAEEADAPARIGYPAPDFEVETLSGEAFRLSENRGKVVYLNIWATWCEPCISEIPDIQRLAMAHPDDLVVIGVSCDEDKSAVEAFAEANGIAYPLAMDADYRIGGILYPAYIIPLSVFIDANGIVTSMHIGAADYETLEGRYLTAVENAAAAGEEREPEA